MANGYMVPGGGLPMAAKALLVPENIRAGVQIKGGGVDVTGTFGTIVITDLRTLGEDQWGYAFITLDVSDRDSINFTGVFGGARYTIDAGAAVVLSNGNTTVALNRTKFKIKIELYANKGSSKIDRVEII